MGCRDYKSVTYIWMHSGWDLLALADFSLVDALADVSSMSFSFGPKSDLVFQKHSFTGCFLVSSAHANL